MQPVPRIPGYDLLQPLGGGPLTAVFAARSLADDSACALKVIRDNWRDDPTAIKLLQREARAALAVRHPHLIRLRRAHVTRPPYYLDAELLAGESLRRRLRRDYRLDLATSLRITRQTAEALQALHNAGFVHGDIKPDNIHLVEDGTAILIDLGFTHRPGENADLRRQGYILGTVTYLAPELCEFEPDAGPASDLFSLGVTLFEMLTGALPYPNGTIRQTFRRHAADPPADIRRHAGPLPPALVTLAERLLDRRPSRRPRAASVINQLVALEITALKRRRSA
jgi:serine/threonine protein kinase